MRGWQSILWLTVDDPSEAARRLEQAFDGGKAATAPRAAPAASQGLLQHSSARPGGAESRGPAGVVMVNLRSLAPAVIRLGG